MTSCLASMLHVRKMYQIELQVEVSKKNYSSSLSWVRAHREGLAGGSCLQHLAVGEVGRHVTDTWHHMVLQYLHGNMWD